jgi:WD40 repeat protein/nucleoside phosphorylase/type II secretory pathway predicted ATPase ExeA
MATKLLDETRIRALHQAALDAGLAAARTDLLRGLDASFVASLPVSSSLSAQLFTDLHELSITLRDGSVPIVSWLKNALSFAGARAEIAVFEQALAHLGHAVPARVTAPVRDETPRPAPGDRLDVVILAALQDELEAVLALGEGGRAGWEEKRDLQKFRYFRRRFPRDGGRDLVIAAAWIGEMGERAATSRGQQLVKELNPACLAMCGICAGWRKKLALGDVVVADRLYSYDHGKIVVAKGGEEELFHDLETFSLEKTWKMDAAFLARAVPLATLAAERPPSREAQRLWLLDALHAHEKEGASPPEARAEWATACPDHAAVLLALDAEKLVDLGAETLALTDNGHKAVRRERRLYPAGRKVDRELRIEVGALATGKTVREDPELFERLARLVRSTIAVDMEGMAIAEVAERFGRRSIVVKAVSDHADHEKDDRYRAFACKASATFLLAFLLKHLDPEPPSGGLVVREIDTSARDPEGVAFLRDRRGAGFVDRVEQVCRLRLPSALLQPQALPYPFDGALMVIVPKTPVTHRELHVALEQPITEEALSMLVGEILPALRRDGPLPCKLVHLAPTAPADLALRAEKLEVELITFSAYQGLVDFSRYTAWLSRRLESDTEYPPWLYVEQPASVSLAGQMPEPVPSALARLRELLTTQERRFALILGDFGAGKSFLLRELARSLLAGDGSIVPVLVEMRYLEKQLSLRGLLAQHFGMANAGSVDIDAFLYMLHQGRVVLLFDGFDELAVRVTYDQVLQHFAVITSAVEGKAKVIVSSRRQHFLDDGRVKLELARSAERLQGYRLVELQPFEETQIRQFLRNRLQDEVEADARYRLIHDVKDLLGLSHNPRMLSFIADLERERLQGARDAAGEITPAKLYEVLLERWLDGECARTQVKKASLWAAVRTFARKLWETPGNALDLSSLPKDLVPRLDGLKQVLSEEEARLVLGSRSLLKRDAEGLFSFVHRSVLEWLVAGEAVSELAETDHAAVLDADAMSPLMARFFVDLAGRGRAEEWARRVFEARKRGTAEQNALRVAAELKLALVVSLAGQDLRGVNLAGLNLRGANLRGVNLEGVALEGRDLTGADLTGARLARSDLRGSVLTDVDLTGADLTFIRLTGADLTGAILSGARLLGADLFHVQGLAKESSARAEHKVAEVAAMATWGIAPQASECWAVVYHPEGHLLATSHHDSSVRLWDAATGQILRVLEGHTASVRSVAFSPDGGQIASGSDDTTIRVWGTELGHTLRVFEGHTGWVRSVAFSPDGRQIASGSADRTIRVWKAASGRVLRVLKGHTASVRSIAFSPDGQKIVSGSEDKSIRVWDAVLGHTLHSLTDHTGWVRSVAFSPDGLQLASGSQYKSVKVWDAAPGEKQRTLAGHTKGVRSVAFSPDGLQLASGSEDRTIRLWGMASRSALRVLSGHHDHVLSAAFSPDGRQLASGSKDKTIKLWDVASGSEQRTLSGHTRSVCGMAFSPDGRSVASGGDKRVRVWDAMSGHKQHALSGHTERVSSVIFSPDGRSLASGSEDTTIRLWDAASGKFLRALSGHAGRVLSVVFSPDGRSLASCCEDRKVRIWDTASGELLRVLSAHPNRLWSMAFSPDGQSLASCSDNRTVMLWDVASGGLLRVLSIPGGNVWSVAFTPDGRSLVSGSEDKLVRLWNARSGELLLSLEGHTGTVTSVAFSSRCQLFASASEDRTIRVWHVASGKLVSVLSGHSASVTIVAFSPDRQSLASGSADGTIRLWDVASGHCLAVLLSTPEGWVSFVPEAHPGGPPRGAFKMGGDIAGSFWHVIGLARFEPGELDEFLPEGQKLRLPDDHLFLPPVERR